MHRKAQLKNIHILTIGIILEGKGVIWGYLGQNLLQNNH